MLKEVYQKSTTENR